jgi:TolB-like protein
MDLLARIFDWLREQEAGFSAVAAILVIGGVVFAGFRWLVGRRSQPTTEAKPEEDPLLALPTGPVVAVLPFENLSEDPKQEYFSDGLTDDIITALSRFKDLFVIARNSTFRYKGQAVDVRQLNKELGARYVLEGSVQRAESRLRVTVQLLDARDGTHLWADRYDRELSAADIFEVQDEITEQVVATIGGTQGVIFRARYSEVKEKPTQLLDAYECVLQFDAYNRDNSAMRTPGLRCPTSTSTSIVSISTHVPIRLIALSTRRGRRLYQTLPVNVRTTCWRLCTFSDTTSTHSPLRPNVRSRSIPTTRPTWPHWATGFTGQVMNVGSF